MKQKEIIIGFILAFTGGCILIFFVMSMRIEKLMIENSFLDHRVTTARTQLYKVTNNQLPNSLTEKNNFQLISGEGFAFIVPADWEKNEHTVKQPDNKRYYVSYFVSDISSMASNNPERHILLDQGNAYEYQRRFSEDICRENGEGNCNLSKVLYLKNIEVSGVKGVEYSTSAPGLNLGEDRGTSISVEQLFIWKGKFYRFNTSQKIAPETAPDLQEMLPVLNPSEIDVFHKTMATLRFE